MDDIVIRNGLIVDGTGGEPYHADVGIKGERISAIAVGLPPAALEIDAEGCIVTPGFIDLHTHYDGQAIWSDRMSPSSDHGVTTVVIGNCGVGFAPCRSEDHERLIDLMQGVEDIPEVVMAEGLPWDWETFPEFLDALDRRQRDVNILAYVPHSAVRVYVMGERGRRREPATDEDIRQMSELVGEAMAAGALGFATSRQFIHRTADGELIPSFDVGEGELSALIKAMGSDEGVFQIVLDVPHDSWARELDMLVRVIDNSSRIAMFTLGQGTSNGEEWRATLASVHAANAKGMSIRAQIFPRPVGIILGHHLSANPFSNRPTYKVLPKDLAARIKELRRPEVRSAILRESDEGTATPLVMMSRDFLRMFPLDDVPNYEPDFADSIAAQAERLGQSCEEVAYDLLLEADGQAMLLVAVGNYCDGNLDHIGEMLVDEACLLGLGDGGAHYGLICDASYPTFMLGHWARDRKHGRITVQRIVQSLTGDSAQAIGLTDRGIVRVGMNADLNVIDHAALRLHKPRLIHDLPAGGGRLVQAADGYRAILVNGQIVTRNGEPTEARPGRLLRKQAPGANGSTVKTAIPS